MIYNINEPRRHITLGTFEVAVFSYRILHKNNIVENVTVDGISLLHSQNLKPITLILNGKFLKSGAAPVKLEEYMSSGEKFSFSFDGLQFTDMYILSYDYSQDGRLGLYDVKLTFTGVSPITVAVSAESGEER